MMQKRERTSKRTPNTRLIDERLRRGWTQEEVADQIGTNTNALNRWENNKSLPGPLYRSRLVHLFEKSEQELGLVAHLDPTAAKASLLDPAIPALIERPIEREVLLSQLQQRLLQPIPAHQALYGLPGVGKTTLAAALVAEQAVQQRYEGILWVGVGPHPHIFELLSRWGRLLGLPSSEIAQNQAYEQWALSLRSAIGRRAFLIVIDDAWTVEAALAFLIGGPNCSYLLTSRLRDVAFSFPSFEATKVEELDEQESILLVKHLAPEIESQEATELVQLVGDLPLALTLIGRYIHVLYQKSSSRRRIQTALEHLRSAEGRLRLTMPLLPFDNKVISLDTALQISFERLSPSARAALQTLSAFPAKPNSFSEEAALALCTDESLNELSDAGLLERPDAERYCLHRVVSDFASTTQQQSDLLAYDQLIAYYVDLVESYTDRYELLEQDYRNILMAFEHAYTRGAYAEFVRGVCAFVPFLQARGLYDSAELHLQRANRAAQANTDLAARCCILLYLGEIEQKRGNYARAEARFNEISHTLLEDEDPELVALKQYGMARIAALHGDKVRACQLGEESLATLQSIGRSHLARQGLNWLATLPEANSCPCL